MRNCPMCPSLQAKTYMKPTAWNNRDKIELKKCCNCSFVFSAASLYDYENMSGQFAKHDKEALLELASKEKIDNLCQEILIKSTLKSGKALDFGAGVGFFALMLQKSGMDTYAVESSIPFIASLQNNDIAAAQSLKELKVPKEYFDLIVLKDVLEHVDNPKKILKELTLFLKPKGYFYIRVPNVYHYPFHWSIDTKSHINHFSPNQLMGLLDEQSFDVVDFIDVYDISTSAGKLYHFVFWKARHWLPMYHQISLLCQKRE